MNNQILNAAEQSTATIVVNDLELVDGKPTEIKKTYHLVLDMRALKLIREKTGVDFFDNDNWRIDKETKSGPSRVHLTTILWAAFQRFYPEITEERVEQMLAPADEVVLLNMLLELRFPGILERAAANAKAAEQPGENQPAESAPV